MRTRWKVSNIPGVNPTKETTDKGQTIYDRRRKYILGKALNGTKHAFGNKLRTMPIIDTLIRPPSPGNQSSDDDTQSKASDEQTWYS